MEGFQLASLNKVMLSNKIFYHDFLTYSNVIFSDQSLVISRSKVFTLQCQIAEVRFLCQCLYSHGVASALIHP